MTIHVPRCWAGKDVTCSAYAVCAISKCAGRRKRAHLAIPLLFLPDSAQPIRGCDALCGVESGEEPVWLQKPNSIAGAVNKVHLGAVDVSGERARKEQSVEIKEATYGGRPAARLAFLRLGRGGQDIGGQLKVRL